MASITNYVGAALDQQLGAVDLRSAQSTQVQSDLLAAKTGAGLLPLDAVFGAGGLAGGDLGLGGMPGVGMGMGLDSLPPLPPLDASFMGPEITDVDDQKDALREQLREMKANGQKGTPAFQQVVAQLRQLRQQDNAPGLGLFQQNFGSI